MDHLKMKEVVEHLRKLGRCEIEPQDPWHGICAELETACGIRVLSGVWLEWPEFSGDRSFPIPYEGLPPEVAFGAASAEEMWSPDYAYGASRRRGCLYLADYYECHTN